jgi:low affinity Fe/Cu permease
MNQLNPQHDCGTGRASSNPIAGGNTTGSAGSRGGVAMQCIRKILTRLGVLTARPAAFAVLAAYTVAWILLNPESLEWHSVATLATWFMTLVIQRAEHRDTQALQAKLDELIRATEKAKTDLTAIDDQEPETIEQQRMSARQDDHLAARPTDANHR